MKKNSSANASLETRRGKWRLHFSLNGKLYRRYYIDNEYEAQLMQDEVNHRLRRLKLGLDTVPPGVSLPDFVFDGVTEIKLPTSAPKTLIDLLNAHESRLVPPIKAASTCYTEKIHINHLRRYCDHIVDNPSLEAIHPGFFNDYKRFRYAAGIKTDTVRKELSSFQAILAQAVSDGIMTKNVLREVKRDKSQVPCDRFRPHSEIVALIATGNYSREEIKQLRRFQYLNLSEIEQLLELIEGKWIAPIVTVCAYTGMRRGELASLEWQDVDLEAKLIYVRSKKQSQAVSATSRRIPMHDRIIPLMHAQKLITGSGRWFFTGQGEKKLGGNNLNETFRRILKETEFEGVGFHTCRHSLASNLAARGVDQHYIDSILGHQTEAMRQRYQHLFPDRVEAALRMMSIL